MALDKNDIQAIKRVVVDAVDTRLTTFEKKIVSELDRRFTAQNRQVANSFIDLKDLIQHTYATKEEVEELKTELEDLKQKVQTLLGTSRNEETSD
jgi:hypothetical protein